MEEPTTYSMYEAKAKFSKVIRTVREGRAVTVSYRGEPVAEIRPIKPRAETIEERLEALEMSGALISPEDPRVMLGPIARRPGALARFLEDRGE